MPNWPNVTQTIEGGKDMLINAKELFNAVQIVECCLGTASKENETLKCLHFKVNNGLLRIAATNLKDYSDEHIPVVGDETCEFLVDGKPFISYVKSLVDLGIEKIEIVIKESVLEIVGKKEKGKGKGPHSNLPITKSDSFPVKDAILSQATIVTTTKEQLIGVLKSTLKIASGAEERFRNLRIILNPESEEPVKVQVTDTVCLLEATINKADAEVVGGERVVFVSSESAELLRLAVSKSPEEKVELNFTDSVFSVQRANGQMISSTLSQGSPIEKITGLLDEIERSAVAMGLFERVAFAKGLSFLTAYKSGKDGDRVFVRLKADGDGGGMTLLKHSEQDRQEIDIEVKNTRGDEFSFVKLEILNKVISSVDAEVGGVVIVGTAENAKTTSANHNQGNRLGLVFQIPKVRAVISPCSHTENPFS